MKLNLTKTRGFSVLEVTERVSFEEAHTLLAGVKKLLAVNKDPLILDMSAAKPYKFAYPVLYDFQLAAFQAKGDLFVVGSDNKMAQFKTVQEIADIVTSGTSLAGIREYILKNLNQDLSERIEKLTPERDALLKEHVVEKNLPHENQNLKNLLSAMIDHGEKLVKQVEEDRAEGNIEIPNEIREQIIKSVKEGRYQVAEMLTIEARLHVDQLK